MVYGNGLENRRGVKATESSNLSLSAKKNTDRLVCIFCLVSMAEQTFRRWYRWHLYHR